MEGKEEEGNTFLNDFSSEEIKQSKTMSPKMKKIIIGVAISLLLIIVISIIIISLLPSKKDDRNDEEDGNNNIPNSFGTITCIYDINDISKETLLLSNDYIKESNFEIYIEDKQIPYSKSFKFSKMEKYIVKFELYEDISLNNMFKNYF